MAADKSYLMESIIHVGQTTQEIRKRHYGHRNEVRSRIAGLGSHFHEMYGGWLDLKTDENFKICVKPPSALEEVQTSHPPGQGYGS